MQYVYEFELYKGQNGFIVEPFDFEGATQGDDLKDAYLSAFDWLNMTLEDYVIKDEKPPKATFENEPKHGGCVFLVGATVGKETINRVSASEASRMLGVSPARINQLAKCDKLDTFKDGGTVWVTVDSINQRLAEAPTAGRPRQAVAVAM
jgi:predicted RNase H-like HicB family nuclease